MQERTLSAQERRFEAYVQARGGSFQVRKTGDRGRTFYQCLVVFEQSHEGQRFEQVTLVTRFDLAQEETWEALLDMLNGTFARALERHIRGVH